MISADGAAGGDYESVRTEILSSVCGISEDKINNSVTTNEALNTSAEKVNTLKEEVAIAFIFWKFTSFNFICNNRKSSIKLSNVT